MSPREHPRVTFYFCDTFWKVGIGYPRSDANDMCVEGTADNFAGVDAS